MYTEFYGLTTVPFTLSPDPKFLYLSDNHQACLSQLLSSIARHDALAVLLGEVGTGKTTLLHSLVARLDAPTHVAFVVHSRLDFAGILQYILHELGLSASGNAPEERLAALQSFVLSSVEAPEKVLVILDEAQNFSADVLCGLLSLKGCSVAENPRFHILLAGQLPLEGNLNARDVAPLQEHLDTVCYLRPLNYDETKRYIETRLTVAGAKYTVFTAEAIEDIYAYSGGIPRVVNIICDHALYLGYTDKQSVITQAIIRQATAHFAGDAAPQPSHSTVLAQEQSAVSPDALVADPHTADGPRQANRLEVGEPGAPQPAHRPSRHRGRIMLGAGLACFVLTLMGVYLQHYADVVPRLWRAVEQGFEASTTAPPVQTVPAHTTRATINDRPVGEEEGENRLRTMALDNGVVPAPMSNGAPLPQTPQQPPPKATSPSHHAPPGLGGGTTPAVSSTEQTREPSQKPLLPPEPTRSARGQKRPRARATESTSSASLKRQQVAQPHPSPGRVSKKTAAVQHPTPDSLHTPAPPAPVQQPRSHTVNLQSDPDGASVFINGKPAGRTPLSVNLQLGSYTILLEKRGHSAARFEINLKGRGTSHLYYPLFLDDSGA